MRARYRAVFLSDVHLGTPWARARRLLGFLERTEARTLYLVGDIVDRLELARGSEWRPEHERVLAALERKARAGTRIVRLRGNHDPADEGELEVEHVAADGRRYLVLHGDGFDAVERGGRRLSRLCVALTRVVERLFPRRTRRGVLAGRVKARVKRASGYVRRFERRALSTARARAVDGVICGHVHHPATRVEGGVAYWNDGDWVESCTALVEHEDGRLELVRA